MSSAKAARVGSTPCFTHQLVVDRLVRLGPVVAGDDVEDRLEMMRHAQPLHDLLGMRHVARGEDDLAAGQRRQRRSRAPGLALDRRVVDVVHVIEVMARIDAVQAHHAAHRGAVVAPVLPSAPGAPPRHRPSASRRYSGRCARRSGRTGCSAPDRACCRGRTARRRDRAWGRHVGDFELTAQLVRLSRRRLIKGAMDILIDRPAGGRRVCWSWLLVVLLTPARQRRRPRRCASATWRWPLADTVQRVERSLREQEQALAKVVARAARPHREGDRPDRHRPARAAGPHRRGAEEDRRSLDPGRQPAGGAVQQAGARRLRRGPAERPGAERPAAVGLRVPVARCRPARASTAC